MTSCAEPAVGEIWLTYLHFIDKPTTGKVRPVLVMGVEDELQVVALKVTTKAPVDLPERVYIKEWESCGLRQPSYVRTDQIFRVSKKELLGEGPLGRVGDQTLATLVENLKAAEEQRR